MLELVWAEGEQRVSTLWVLTALSTVLVYPQQKLEKRVERERKVLMCVCNSGGKCLASQQSLTLRPTEALTLHCRSSVCSVFSTWLIWASKSLRSLWKFYSRSNSLATKVIVRLLFKHVKILICSLRNVQFLLVTTGQSRGKLLLFCKSFPTGL